MCYIFRDKLELLVFGLVVEVWFFWIQCSSPFQAKQLERYVTKSVGVKHRGQVTKLVRRGMLPGPDTGNEESTNGFPFLVYIE